MKLIISLAFVAITASAGAVNRRLCSINSVAGCKTEGMCNHLVNGECALHDSQCGYQCQCAEGWEGVKCDQEKACDADQCDQGTLSGNKVTGCKCECNDGWGGDKCDQEITKGCDGSGCSDTFWVNTAEDDLDTRIVSFNDNNKIYVNDQEKCTGVHQGKMCDVVTSLGDRITSTYPVEAHAADPDRRGVHHGINGFDLNPGRTAGTEFVYTGLRSNPQRVIVCALDKATTVTWSGATSGTTELAAHECGYKSGNWDGRTVSLWSTELIVTSGRTNVASDWRNPGGHSPYDYHIITPATGETLYGVPSGTARVALFCKNGAPSSGTVHVKCKSRTWTHTVSCGYPYNFHNPSHGHAYSGESCAVTAEEGQKLCITSYADGNGGDAAQWLRAADFRNTFYLPHGSDYVSVTSASAGTVTIDGSDHDLTCGNGVCGYYNAGNNGNWAKDWNQGVKITSTVPVMIYGQLYDNDGDEFNLWGHNGLTF